MTVRITQSARVNAQLRAPHSADLNARVRTYHGARWVSDWSRGKRTGEGHWSIPARHLPKLLAELQGAGYDVQRTSTEGAA